MLRDSSLVPKVTRSFFQVTAGETYYLKAALDGEDPEDTAKVMLNVRPVESLPDLGAGGVQMSLSKLGFLSVEIPVVSPNGFSSGVFTMRYSSVVFTAAHRVSGDAYEGCYRVVMPWYPSTSPITLSYGGVRLQDRLGGLSSVSVPTVRLDPVLIEGDPVDFYGPRFEGIAGGELEIPLGGESAVATLELAISDAGGSGFLEGQIVLPGSYGELQVEDFYEWPEPAEQQGFVDFGGDLPGVKFGPAERVRGDAQVGIYRVEVPIPAQTPLGSLQLRLRDRFGVVTRSWQSRGWDPMSGPFYFFPGVTLPVQIVRPDIEELTPVELVDGKAEVMEARVRCRAMLSHPAGVSGGQVILSDSMGTVVGVKSFSELHLIEGSEREGSYEVDLPIPYSDGRYWVAWQAVGVDGEVEMHRMVAKVELSGRDVDDLKTPTLTEFQISPAMVDSKGRPLVMEVSLAAIDDRAGLTAAVQILDADLRVLAVREVVCETPDLGCSFKMQLPPKLMEGIDPAAQVIVTLRDAAGREVVYGKPESPAWPEGVVPELNLFSQSLDHYSHWRNLWLGRNQDESLTDSDGDGWDDLLEYAFATDPGVNKSEDALVNRLPKIKQLHPLSSTTGIKRSMSLGFQVAPWFEWTGEKFLSEDYELFSESSTDLIRWERRQNSYRESNSREATATSVVPNNERGNWMRARVRERE